MLFITNNFPGVTSLLLFISLSLSNFKQDNNYNEIYTLSPVEKQQKENLPDLQIIEEQVEEFMEKYHVPGASIAIAKEGKLVYAKGFGYANKTTGEKITPFHLFRIASLSKPITSIAIMKLVEQGKISLNDKVFGTTGILNHHYSLADPTFVEKITVRNLLEHTAGGWTNDEQDPMFQYPDYDQNQLIDNILANRTLTYEPGSKYVYSNFGYCILGRIIEKVTGQSYASYVKTTILEPIGITTMHIGGDTEAQKHIGEVTYYSQDLTNPYSMKINRMDAMGGWIASASDLLRLLVHIDSFDCKPHILSLSSLAEMSTPSQPNPGYALGWEVDKNNNWWHSGSLPGTGAILVRTQEGYCWTMLVNSRNTDRRAFFNDMDRSMWKIVRSVKEWPTQDLFEYTESNTSLIGSAN